MRYFSPLSVALLLLSPVVSLAADPVSGWRGNQTGLWPDAKPPLEWHRIPRGALDGMSAVPPYADPDYARLRGEPDDENLERDAKHASDEQGDGQA